MRHDGPPGDRHAPDCRAGHRGDAGVAGRADPGPLPVSDV